MIYDERLSLPLASTLGPPLPTTFLDGLERFLFRGTWSRRAATTTASAAVVLARCHGALRDAGATGFAVDSDADELVALRIGSERWGEDPPPWAENMPRRWLDAPCAFRLRACWVEEGFSYAVQVRHQPRHDADVDGLVGVVRVGWVVPDRAEGDLGADLAATFAGAGALRELRGALLGAGDGVLGPLVAGLGERFGGAVISWRDVVVLHQAGDRPQAFADLLGGLDPRAVAAVPHLTAAASTGAWSAVDERGVPGRRVAGRFHPVAEVLDVV